MNEFGMDLLWLILLVLLYGFFTLGKTALVALNDRKLEKQAETDGTARRLMRLLSEPGRFLTVINGDRVLICLMAGALCMHGPVPAAARWLLALGLPTGYQIAAGIATAAALVLLFFFLLLFGSLIPKHLGGRNPEPIAYRMAAPLSGLIWLTGWLSMGVSCCAKGLFRLFRSDSARQEGQVTQEEIRMMVDVGEEKGVILASEKAMIDNIFAFGDRTAGEIMTHRTDIVAIEADASLEEILQLVAREGYSRIPVYVETLDNIIGTLHVKDLFPYVRGEKPFDLASILHHPYVAPESKKADELFRELKRTKKYIAILIDEYGGTAGMVTMEDLMESIVGNIFDEYDQEETEPIQQVGGDLLFDGSVPWEEAARRLGVAWAEQEQEEEYETISGFLLARLERIPESEEHPQVEYEGWRFVVRQMTGRRIAQVLASPLPKPAPSLAQGEKEKPEKGGERQKSKSRGEKA